MKCPKCKCEAKEVEISVFESEYSMVDSGFDPFGLVSLAKIAKRGAKKARLAIQEKKLYRCSNENCLHEFEA